MGEQEPEADRFRAFEHEGWERAFAGYAKWFGNLTPGAVPPLLDAAAVGEGRRVLDIATGPGYVAGAAAERGGRVTAIDFSAEMIREAKRRLPHIDFRKADVEELPFPEASFDAVVANFGLLHFARPERALAEMARVLRPGGRVALTVWDEPKRTVPFAIVLRAVEAHGSMNVGLPAGPPFFRFADRAEFARTLEAAGFRDPRFQEIALSWTFRSAADVFQAAMEGTVRTAGLLARQSSEAREAIRRFVTEQVQAFRTGETYTLPIPAVLGSATR